MTRSQAPWAILVAALLSSCADDSARLAGGTGSDLPRPVARLLDSNLSPIPAKVWRIWEVDGESLKRPYQVLDTQGFEVPRSGSWIVEAWNDTAQLGALADLTPQATPKVECYSRLSLLRANDSVVGIVSCPELLDTTGSKRPLSLKAPRTPIPVAAGFFKGTLSIRTMYLAPGMDKAFRFHIWKIDTSIRKRTDSSSSDQKIDSVGLVYWGYNVSPVPKLLDTTLEEGDWFVEGWGSNFSSSQTEAEWKSLETGTKKFADPRPLEKCLKDRIPCDDPYNSKTASILFAIHVAPK